MTKHKLRKAGKLNTTYQGIVTYLVCIYCMRQCLVNQWLRKLQGELNLSPTFCVEKNIFFTTGLKWLLWNSFIQLYFGSNLKKIYNNNRIQITQNKCLWIFLILDKLVHILQNEFEKLTWLQRNDQIKPMCSSDHFPITQWHR